MTIHVYQDDASEWRWRAVAANGQIVADGSEGYSTKDDAGRAVINFMAYFKNENVTVTFDA